MSPLAEEIAYTIFATFVATIILRELRYFCLYMLDLYVSYFADSSPTATLGPSCEVITPAQDA